MENDKLSSYLNTNYRTLSEANIGAIAQTKSVRRANKVHIMKLF